MGNFKEWCEALRVDKHTGKYCLESITDKLYKDRCALVYKRVSVHCDAEHMKMYADIMKKGNYDETEEILKLVYPKRARPFSPMIAEVLTKYPMRKLIIETMNLVYSHTAMLEPLLQMYKGIDTKDGWYAVALALKMNEKLYKKTLTTISQNKTNLDRMFHLFPEAMDIFENYKMHSRTLVANALVNLIKEEDMKPHYLLKTARMFKMPEIRDTLKHFEAKTGKTKIIIANNLAKIDYHIQDNKVTAEVAETLKSYKDNRYHSIPRILYCIASHTKDSKQVKYLSRVYKKYGDLHENISKVISFDYTKDFDFGELLREEVYKQITNSENPEGLIEDCLFSGLGSVRMEITDDKFREKVKLSDLLKVKKTFSLVMEIHRERDRDDSHKIIEGFFEEMNRVIYQGKDYKAQAKYLRQYCKEVEKQMKDNAKDLMVITNES